MDKLFRISEIAKFFGITAGTLRYYEQYGLIKPAYIDPYSQYRYYNVDNVNTISYITELRHTDLSMQEIKEFLDETFSTVDIVKRLKEKRNTINHLIEINESKLVDKSAPPKIKRVSVPSFCVVSADYVADGVEEIKSLFSSFLLDCVTKYTLEDTAATFAKFDTCVPQFDNINVQISIKVKNQPNGDDVKISQPFDALQAFHKGDYVDIERTYSALTDYAAKYGITLDGTAYEYYYETYNVRKSPDDYLTKVLLPIG